MALVIAKYPQQALWPTVGVMQSNRGDRKEACNSVLTRAQVSPVYDIMADVSMANPVWRT